MFLLLILLYRLMFGDGSLQQYLALREEARTTHTELIRLRLRNQALEAEVTDLKSGLDAIEERARTELGMIDENETFYQFVKKRGSAASVRDDDSAVLRDNSIGGAANGSVVGSNDAEQIDQAPIDEDGSAVGRPNGPDAEALIIPGSISQSGN